MSADWGDETFTVRLLKNSILPLWLGEEEGETAFGVVLCTVLAEAGFGGNTMVEGSWTPPPAALVADCKLAIVSCAPNAPKLGPVAVVVATNCVG